VPAFANCPRAPTRTGDARFAVGRRSADANPEHSYDFRGALTPAGVATLDPNRRITV